jgi:uroporphyrinogen III methyltransferase / synthase
VTVYLVGAGPGDPGLLTVRGAEVLSRADVVVYDRLSVSSLLDLAPAQAERISVGKARGETTIPQHEINALLVQRGSAGQEVVRLKGGDPFVFARGGEEAAALLTAGVPFEVVPGITSAVAVPAFAGVPVTHRGLSTSFTVVTGHEDPWAAKDTDWDAVARVGGTIVVLMGVATRGAIAARLMEGGLDADTPVVAVRWGTRPEQRSVRTTLGGLGAAALDPPATIVIGAVAGLDLRWFEARPLFGRRVVVTRARDQASALTTRLRMAGADTVELPVIRVVDPSDDGAAMRAAAARVHEFDWVVLTSANGAERLCRELRDARAFGAARVAAIGPGTATELRRWGVAADLVPPRFVAESMVEAFPSGTGRVLLARAAVARDALPDGLRAKGWTVDVVEAYRTEPGRATEAMRAAARAADAVTFTSSSTVTNYLEAVGDDPVPRVVACIGPVTAATARRRGLHVDVEAVEHTIEGLVDALVAHLGQPRPGP